MTEGGIIDRVLLAMLAFTAVAIARQRDLLSATMLAGIFSLLGAGWMVFLDAPDVAFTEAAVGAGVSTILVLAALVVTGREEKRAPESPVALAAVLLTGAVLVYSTFDMPWAGAPDSPANSSPVTHVYLESARQPDESSHTRQYAVGIPNTVTTVLASFRGYDTMGETAVIFTAGLGVVAILRGARHRRFLPSRAIDVSPHPSERHDRDRDADGGAA